MFDMNRLIGRLRMAVDEDLIKGGGVAELKTGQRGHLLLLIILGRPCVTIRPWWFIELVRLIR